MLSLAIETSTSTFAVALGDGGRALASRVLGRTPPAHRNLPALAEALLADAGYAFGDLERIAVDVGPGNLTAVRTGVAYANGLAFALGIGIATADSLELMAAQVEGPALCLRNAGGGRAYAGVFGDGASYRHGPLAEVVAGVTGPRIAVAGDFRAEVERLLPDTPVKDTGIAGPDAVTLLGSTAGRGTLDPTRQRAASPLTEASELFGGAE